jgi:hypothetical protein
MSNFHAASASTLQFTLALVVGGELRFGATLYLSALGIDLISSPVALGGPFFARNILAEM